jgi:ABC-type polysaccharide/polyol phosphate export permease
MKLTKTLIYVSWRIAYSEILIKYRRSIFGPAWISINMLVTIFALSIVFSNLFNMEIKNYVPFVFCGLLSWGFISLTILDSVQLYINGAIKNFNFPVFFFPLKNTFKNLIIFLHNSLIYIIILIAVNKDILSLNFLYIIIAFPIYILNSVFISLSIGLVSLRFRDVGQIITNGVFLIFLVTPVFWDPSILSGKKIIISELNPLYHLIEIMRQPLLGKVPSYNNYFFSIIVTIINAFLAYISFKKYFNNKAFWI